MRKQPGNIRAASVGVIGGIAVAVIGVFAVYAFGWFGSASPDTPRFELPTWTPTTAPVVPEPARQDSISGCVVTTKFGARLQSKPDMLNSITLAELPTDRQYKPTDRSDEFPIWFYVTENGQGGWVSSQFLVVDPACVPSSDIEGVSLADCTVTTKFGAKLSSKPDMLNSVTLAELPTDQQYPSTKRSDKFPTWFYVVHNGQGGWVSSQFLVVSGGCVS